MTGIDKYTIVAADQQKKTVGLKFEKDGKTYEITRKSQMAALIERKRAASKVQTPPKNR